jgi:hypothetical protein
MKSLRILATALLLSVVSFHCLGQAGPPPYKTYDYVTITVWGETPNVMYVSYNGGGYEKIKIGDKTHGDFDYSEAMTLINGYEAEGFELFANNFIPHVYVSPGTNYFLLRREHRDTDKDKDKFKDKALAHDATNEAKQ